MSVLTDARNKILPRDLFYGWWIALAGAVSSFLTLGVTTYGFGVFVPIFKNELGWSAAAIGVGASIRTLESGFMSPAVGYVMDKVGPRLGAMAGIILTSASLFLLAGAHRVEMYYVSAGIGALGNSFGSSSVYSLALMRWFAKSRGKVLGVMSIGNGFAYLGALIIGAMILWVGWRESLVILASVILVGGLPLALVIRDWPEDMGYLPDGERMNAQDGTAVGEAPSRVSQAGMEVKEVLRTPAFYLLGLAQASGSVAQTAWLVFGIHHMENVGFSVRTAGLVVAAYGFGQIVFRLVSGWAGDKYGRKRVFVAGVILMGVGMISFAFLSSTRVWLLPLVVVVYGFGNACWFTGFFTAPVDYFGPRRFATIRGLINISALPLTVAVPIFIGTVFDRTGAYRPAFVVLGMISLAGTLSLFAIRRKPFDPRAQANPVTAAGTLVRG